MGGCYVLDKIHQLPKRVETRKTIIKEVGQSQKVIIVFKLGANKYKPITHERVILTRLIK